jgi:hypothetical protein
MKHNPRLTTSNPSSQLTSISYSRNIVTPFKPTLLTLPAEIRQLIWSYTKTDEEDLSAMSIAPAYGLSHVRFEYLKALADPLFLTCKQTRADVMFLADLNALVYSASTQAE